MNNSKNSSTGYAWALLAFWVAVASSGCSQNAETSMAVSQQGAASPGVEELKVTALPSRIPESLGNEVYVRVTDNIGGNAVRPVSGLEKWAEKDPGVFFYAVPENGVQEAVVWSLPSGAGYKLHFSKTQYAGRVKVEWRGKATEYDLYSTPNSTETVSPIDLNSAIPETY